MASVFTRIRPDAVCVGFERSRARARAIAQTHATLPERLRGSTRIRTRRRSNRHCLRRFKSCRSRFLGASETIDAKIAMEDAKIAMADAKIAMEDANIAIDRRARPSPSTLAMSVTSSFTSVKSLTTKANVYFDGKCVSHAFVTATGEEKTAGVVLGANTELTFGTSRAERMECVAGKCEYRLANSTAWVGVSPGESFEIAKDSKFDIRVEREFHYVCHYA